jgi:hypothetical protein
VWALPDPVAVRVGGPLARFQVGRSLGRRPTFVHPDARREPCGPVPGPVNFPRGPETDRCRSRSAAQELALPTAVLADFGRISSWSDKSIKARWRNEAGDLVLDEAAESGCCFVAAACGYRLIGGRKSRLGETGRTYGRRRINEAGIARPKQSSGRSGQSPRGTSREFAADNSVSRSLVRQRRPPRALKLRAAISPCLEG